MAFDTQVHSVGIDRATSRSVTSPAPERTVTNESSKVIYDSKHEISSKRDIGTVRDIDQQASVPKLSYIVGTLDSLKVSLSILYFQLWLYLSVTLCLSCFIWNV